MSSNNQNIYLSITHIKKQCLIKKIMKFLFLSTLLSKILSHFLFKNAYLNGTSNESCCSRTGWRLMNWLINDPMVIWGDVRWILPVDWCDDREKCEFGKWPPIILIWSSLFSKDFSMRLTCGTSTAVRFYVVPLIIKTKLYLYDIL